MFIYYNHKIKKGENEFFICIENTTYRLIMNKMCYMTRREGQRDKKYKASHVFCRFFSQRNIYYYYYK